MPFLLNGVTQIVRRGGEIGVAGFQPQQLFSLSAAFEPARGNLCVDMNEMPM